MTASQQTGEEDGPQTPGQLLTYLPSEFSVTYLHVGQTVRHILEFGRIRWFLDNNPTVHEHECRIVWLAAGLCLLAFSKGPVAAQISTYLVIDTESGAVFDASYMPNPRGSWRFDRGAMGEKVNLGTPSTFPRATVTVASDDPTARAFLLPRELTLVVTGGKGTESQPPTIEILGSREVAGTSRTYYSDVPKLPL